MKAAGKAAGASALRAAASSAASSAGSADAVSAKAKAKKGAALAAGTGTGDRPLVAFAQARNARHALAAAQAAIQEAGAPSATDTGGFVSRPTSPKLLYCWPRLRGRWRR